MVIELQKSKQINETNNLSEIMVFISKIEKLKSKKEIASALLSYLSSLFEA